MKGEVFNIPFIINFNKDIIYNFFNPVTDLYGSDSINASLKHGTGNSRYYFLWLFFPYDQYGNFTFGVITYCVGPFVLYFLFVAVLVLVKKI